MIKKKLTAVAAAALAACSISATAFATVTQFGPFSLVAGGNGWVTDAVKKTDDLHAYVNVEDGLVVGNYYATFVVFNNTNSKAATDPTDLWINGIHYIDYKPGEGINGERYRLGVNLEKQANADRLIIGGTWEP